MAVKRDRNESWLTAFICWNLILACFYNWYRYPFQINSESTSPTYHNTPALLSAGKYILFLTGALFALLLQGGRIRIPKGYFSALYAYLLVIPMFYGAALQHAAICIPGLFFALPLLLHSLPVASISIRRLNRLIAWIVVIGIVANLVEIGLFLSWGRLPALAYPDSIAVRFGSFLDDPNGFGVLCGFFIGFVIVSFNRGRGISLALLFLCLIATQSGTAIFSVAIAVMVYGVTRLRLRIKRSAISGMLTAATLAVGIGVALFIFREPIVDILTEVAETKRESAFAHLSAWDLTKKEFSLLNIFGLEPQEYVGEAGYADLLLTYGGVYVVAYSLAGLSAVVRYGAILRTGRGGEGAKAFASGAFCFLVAAYAATANLPVPMIFPLNLLIALLEGLITSGTVIEFQRAAVGKQAAVPRVAQADARLEKRREGHV